MNNEWKIIRNSELGSLRQILRPEKVIITGGYFDPIHKGHIRLIQEAKSRRGKLVVCVNDDESTRAKKGYCLLPLEDRMVIISQLESVDWVLEVNQLKFPMTYVLGYLNPDLYCKGGDRTPDNMDLMEIAVCENIGCKIEYGVGGANKDGSSSDYVEQAAAEIFTSCLFRDLI